MFKSKSTSMIQLGILAVIAGTIAWPGVTILTPTAQNEEWL
jgi:hypothetical protein